MIRYLMLIMTICLASCEGANQGVPSTGGSSSGGVANALVGGLATGAGMAAGHHMINGAVNKWQERKAIRSTAPVGHHGGFNRMSRGSHHR